MPSTQRVDAQQRRRAVRAASSDKPSSQANGTSRRVVSNIGLAPQAKAADAAVGENTQLHVRSARSAGCVGAQEMARVRRELRAREQRLPVGRGDELRD